MQGRVPAGARCGRRLVYTMGCATRGPLMTSEGRFLQFSSYSIALPPSALHEAAPP